VFRGAEPDENRLNIETPRLDSWAARVSWQSAHWNVQFSGGHLKQPEWWEPYDETRLTASIGFDGILWSRRLIVTAAWGENRQFNGFNGNVDGYLLEFDYRLTPHSSVYGRGELAAKEIFGMAPHSRDYPHRHTFYDVAPVTLGYVHDVTVSRAGAIGVGADATVYGMDPNLLVYYESSKSFHLFVRWRPAHRVSHVH
jgi:hypothetical protein